MQRYRVCAPPSENSPGNCCGHAVYIRSECRWFFFLTWRRLFSTGDYFRGGLVTRFRRDFSASLRQMANATSSPPPPSSSGKIVPADKPVQNDREDDDSPGSLTMKASIFRLRVKSRWGVVLSSISKAPLYLNQRKFQYPFLRKKCFKSNELRTIGFSNTRIHCVNSVFIAVVEKAYLATQNCSTWI